MNFQKYIKIFQGRYMWNTGIGKISSYQWTTECISVRTADRKGNLMVIAVLMAANELTLSHKLNTIFLKVNSSLKNSSI